MFGKLLSKCGQVGLTNAFQSVQSLEMDLNAAQLDSDEDTQPEAEEGTYASASSADEQSEDSARPLNSPHVLQFNVDGKCGNHFHTANQDRSVNCHKCEFWNRF